MITRALNIALDEAEVIRRCTIEQVCISAIEPLRSGGTHLVCKTIEGADHMRTKLGDKLILGPVDRTPFFVPPSRFRR